MARVTGYKCSFQTNDERFKFVLTLAGVEAGDADFVVADPDAAETLLDMLEDSSEAYFDEASGELTFTFDKLELDEEDEDDEHEEEEEESESADAAEERVSRPTASIKRAKPRKGRRSAA
jgi:hypothetical protein